MNAPRVALPPRVTLRREPVYRPIIAMFLSMIRLLQLRFRIRGAENIPAQGGAVLALTHFGYLEFAMTGAGVWWERRRLLRFLATRASFRHPITGPVMKGMHHIPVDRAGGADAYRTAVDALGRGELIGVFPEGMVSRSWTLKPFKTGAARMAAQSGAPLIPVVIWGGHRVLTKGRRPSWRAARKVTVSLTYGTPLHPGPEEDPVAVTAQLRAQMAAMVDAAQADYPDLPTGDPWWLPAHRGGSAPSVELAEQQDAAARAARRSRR